MYEDRRNSFSIRDIILQILLIVLFVFIMVWLFPTKNYLKDNNVIDSTELYNNYITNMTEAAKDYFTTDKVPTKTGDSSKLTLNEMLEKKLLLEIGGNASCDAEKSYVEITKMTSEYQLRVELSCTDYSNYVLVPIGCTDFCTDCNTTVTKPVTKPTTTKPSTTKPSTTEQQTKYTVTFDSKGGSAVASQTVVSGKTATKPANPTKEGYTFVEWTLNGEAYDFNSAVTNNITLVATWNEVVEQPKEEVVTLYQYVKEVNEAYTYYTDWSDWSSTKTYWGTKLPYANSDEKEYTIISTGKAENGKTEQSCTTTDKETVDTKDATTKVEEGKVNVTMGTKYSWSTGKEITSTVPLNEYYKGETIVSSEALADTKYTFVTTDIVTTCETRCSNDIVYIYKKQSKVATATVNYSCPEGYTEEGSGTNLKCTKTSYTCETYGKDYKLEGTSCVKYGTEKVQNCKDVAVKEAYVKYQYRTRTLENGNNVSYVYEWSESNNDAELIEAGYTLTGETKTK